MNQPNVTIPFNRASIGAREIENLRIAISNGHIAGAGPFTEQAETLLSQMHNGSRVLLTTSCTHSLELAARLLDLQPNDEVIVPAFTFVSTASAFVWNGARPIFADVDPETLNIDPNSVLERISPRTRAICLVHYAGVGAQPDVFREICANRELTLIEDNAHGLGAAWNGKKLGTFGELATLSFHETKNITCGEGGALVVNNPALVARAEVLREKGTNRSAFGRGEVNKYTWLETGSSWVLSDLLAGILTAQLNDFQQVSRERERIWNRYYEELIEWASSNGVQMPVIPENADHSSHMFHLRFSSEQQRDTFIGHLKGRGIHAVFHYQSLNLSPAGRKLSPGNPNCPQAEQASRTLVRLPLFRELTEDQVTYVIDSVREFSVSDVRGVTRP